MLLAQLADLFISHNYRILSEYINIMHIVDSLTHSIAVMSYLVFFPQLFLQIEITFLN